MRYDSAAWNAFSGRFEMRLLVGAATLAALGSAGLAGLGSAGLAAESADHSRHMGTGDLTEAARAYVEINDRMHDGMAFEFTGDADVDFVRGMIAHHRGAVEMAEVVIRYGDDPEVRRLAEAVIAAQEAEIAWMEGWLAANGQ